MKKILSALLFSLWTSVAGANVPCALPFNLLNGTTADATQVMANYNALVSCLTLAALAGSNNDITALLGLTTPINAAQGGTTAYVGSVSSGSANAQVVATTTPTTFVRAVGTRVFFTPNFTNTSSMTLNVSATGVAPVLRPTASGGLPLIGGEVVIGQFTEAIWDGAEYILLTNWTTPGPGLLTNLASAATTDLGTIPSHNVQVTGGVTITSFGSSASTTYPVYNIKFTGVTTLTRNAVSLELPCTQNLLTASNDTAVALYFGSGNWQIISYQRANGNPVCQPLWTASTVTLTAHNGGFSANGSGNYTPPTNCRMIKITIRGGGSGGGGGNNSTASTAGGATTFGGILTAGGGGTSSNSVLGGGGSASGGNLFNNVGNAGASGTGTGTANNGAGGTGGAGDGGAGGGGYGAGVGSGGVADSGSGGGGGGQLNATAANAGMGGAAGGQVVHLIVSPVGPYAYSVAAGGGGAAGSTNGAAGGAGAGGKIYIEEFY